MCGARIKVIWEEKLVDPPIQYINLNRAQFRPWQLN